MVDCKNCGHEIWNTNRVRIYGDADNCHVIEFGNKCNCGCTNPEPKKMTKPERHELANDRFNNIIDTRTGKVVTENVDEVY